MTDRGDRGNILYRTFVPEDEHAAAKKALKKFKASVKKALREAEKAERALKLKANAALYSWGKSITAEYNEELSDSDDELEEGVMMCNCINCLLDEEVGERRSWTRCDQFNDHATANGTAGTSELGRRGKEQKRAKARVF